MNRLPSLSLRWPSRPVALWAARIALGGLFLAACTAKILDPAAFALAVHRYRLLPAVLVNAVAILLPWLEALTALAVLFGPRRARAPAALLLAGMLTIFTGAISINLLRGVESSCGCFSTRADAAVSDGWNLLRNAALIALAAAVFWDAFRAHLPLCSPTENSL